MDFISNQELQVKEMLQTIGISDIEELFADIPSHLKLVRPQNDDGLSEGEGMLLMEKIAEKNTFPHFISFLGAGAYEHHVPAIVNAICSKSEFLTSYTPYQPEASQGMLQATFEFQSSICALTGMDVSNASLYDGATACAEALLMALRCKPDRNKVAVVSSLHPHYRSVVEQYLNNHATQIEWIPFDSTGRLDQPRANSLIDDKTAAVLLQYPNFFGVIDEIPLIAAKARACQALTIVCANPIVYGLYASAAELGADIAIGDGQPLGLPLQFGGPYVGYLACRSELVRQMPGRVVGETTDKQGRRGFVLTLQAREQHIRREKATSNICTNQALAALAVLITLLWYGKKGLQRLALTNYQRAAYLKKRLEELPHVKSTGEAPFFNEFVISFERPAHEVLPHFRNHGIEPGLNLGLFYPEQKARLLVSVTETKSKEMLDRYVEVAAAMRHLGEKTSG
jgi:glycine dehydrogenase subunit 1